MRNRWLSWLVVMVAAASLDAAALDAASLGLPPGGSLHRLSLQGLAIDHVNYLLYVPPDSRRPGQGWPLILFLHGSEQRGDDPSVLESLPILAFAEENPDFPFVAVVPQCPRYLHWSPVMLKEMLDVVEAAVLVDRSKVYLTGFSMGGYGVWQTAAAYPGVFAAIAPVCGPSDLPDAPLLAAMPVWAFHGALDQNVPLSESQKMVDALGRAGGKTRLTVYPDASHDCWDLTYRDSRLYLWFLAHALGDGALGGDSTAE
jgi:predicted peptidase